MQKRRHSRDIRAHCNESDTFIIGLRRVNIYQLIVLHYSAKNVY